jgi:chromosome segregation ATPase
MEKKKLRQQFDQLEQSYRTLKMDYSDMEEQKYDEQRKCQHLQNLLDQREHDMELLEDELVKLVSHAESLEKQLRESNHELEQKEEEYTARIRDENNTKIQSYLQQQQQQQENTMLDLEKKFSILMATELKQKEAHYRHLESNMAEAHAQAQDDAKQRYEDDLQLLEIKFNQVEQSIRERDVRIASLEGHLEAQTDATDREKQIRQEEIKELEEQLQDALSTIQQQQRTLGQLQQQTSVSHIFDTSDEMNLAKQVWRHCYTRCALLNLLFP